MAPEKRIEGADPHAGYDALRSEIDAAIAEVLESRRYVLGPAVEAFEENFARYIGARFAIGVNSGTDAIHLAIRALGIGRGDEVITVSHTSGATVAAVEMSGAEPVLVDVEPGWLTIDPGAVERAIGPRTRAVLAVHLYGQSADLAALRDICDRHGLALVEDCAQSHGARWGRDMLGSFGDAACFSFYPTKNLGTVGDGGMILTSRAEVAERARRLRQYGWSDPQWSDSPGWNSRLGPIEAAILDVKLRHLPAAISARRALAAGYGTALDDLPLTLPRDRPGAVHAYHLFVVLTQDGRTREALRAHLGERGIAAQIHYPAPVHVQPAYAGRLRQGDLSETEAIAPRLLSLPLYPELGPERQERVVEAARSFAWERQPS